jgi:hypothetical protein
MKQEIQKTLESIGIPVSLAEKSAEILELEALNSSRERTPEEQEIISHAHTWWVAQGAKGSKKRDTNE